MADTISRQDLLRRIDRLRSRGRTVLIAIDGWGGAGKTTLAHWLADQLSAAVVCSDDFSRSGAPQWDWSRFAQQVLSPILKGEKALYQRYDWGNDRLAEWHEIEPGGVLIAEGVSISRRELGDPWDLKVWVECPYELRLERGMERDGETMRETWVEVWMPEEQRYVSEQQPQERADFVILGIDPE